MAEGRRKGRWIDVTLVAALVLGLLIFLYPTISDFYNNLGIQKSVQTYDETVSEMSEQQCEALIAAAEEYNASLPTGDAQEFVSGEPQDDTYESLLNVDGDGMIGYVTINKTNTNLPIYHGTSDEALAQGTGHLEGSSLPVGGDGTHAVITGHRGLPSATLFTNLDQLDVGDTFSVTVLDHTYVYKVDLISIVDPDDVSKLLIEPGKDYVTLLTCTPYGVNTQRLLVRGVRTNDEVVVDVQSEAFKIQPGKVAAVVTAGVAVVVLVVLGIRSLRDRRRKERHEADGR